MIASRPHHFVQPLHHGGEQRRREILQNVPEKDAIEMAFGVIQGLAEK
jgi:hypothetical protein